MISIRRATDTQPLPGPVLLPRQTERHVLVLVQPGHQLGHDALPSNGPPHFVPNILIKDLTVELALGFNAQHPQGGRDVEVPGDPDVAKVNVEGDTPDRQPI